MARYAWIIDTVGSEIAEYAADSVGTIGPRGATNAQCAALQGKPRIGRTFRIYDDDGVFYYSGRIIGDYYGFEPLDDYGTPNDGATEIRYQDWDTQSGPFVAI